MGKVLLGALGLVLATPAYAAVCGAGPPPPRVAMISPGPLEREVPTNAVVVVQYQGSAFESADFARVRLRGPAGTPIEVDAEAQPWPNGLTTTVRLTPIEPLAPETWYTIIGTFGFGEPVQLGSFETGLDEDLVPPALPAFKLEFSELECACCRADARYQRVDLVAPLDEPVAIDVALDGELVAPGVDRDAYGILGPDDPFPVSPGPTLYHPWRAPEGRHLVLVTAYDRAGNASVEERATYDSENGCACRAAPHGGSPGLGALLALIAACYTLKHEALRRGGRPTRRRGLGSSVPAPRR